MKKRLFISLFLTSLCHSMDVPSTHYETAGKHYLFENEGIVYAKQNQAMFNESFVKWQLLKGEKIPIDVNIPIEVKYLIYTKFLVISSFCIFSFPPNDVFKDYNEWPKIHHAVQVFHPNVIRFKDLKRWNINWDGVNYLSEFEHHFTLYFKGIVFYPDGGVAGVYQDRNDDEYCTRPCGVVILQCAQEGIPHKKTPVGDLLSGCTMTNERCETREISHSEYGIKKWPCNEQFEWPLNRALLNLRGEDPSKFKIVYMKK